jgi:hypothetical protein
MSGPKTLFLDLTIHVNECGGSVVHVKVIRHISGSKGELDGARKDSVEGEVCGCGLS